MSSLKRYDRYFRGHSLIAQLVKNLPAKHKTPVRLQGQEDPLEKGQATTPGLLGFPCGSAGKESACNVGYLGLIPGLERSPGEGKGYPLQYSGLENSMDYTVHGVTKSQTRLNDFHHHHQSLCCYLPEPVRHSTRDKGHEEGGSAYAKAGSSLRSPPRYSRASTTQKNQSLPTLLLCALTSDFTGGLSPTTISLSVSKLTYSSN